MAQRRHTSFIKKLFVISISLGLFISGGVLLWASTFRIPDLETFNELGVDETTKIYDRTGEVLLYGVSRDKQRTVTPFADISRHIKNATVAIEDAEFYEHHGIKPSAILRAIFVNITSLGFEQGGSTITQQVVKNSLLTTEKTIPRKLKEWVLSLKLEKAVGKERILELYLNEVPYGGNIYGVEEASKVFFDKSASELTLPEAAYLAALPQAPTYYSPYGSHRDDLDERKNLVLKRMFELGFISEKEYTEARETEIVFQPQSKLGIRAPHFVFYILEQLETKYGKRMVEGGGLRIKTTLDFKLQERAEQIVKEYALQNKEKFNAENAGLVAIDPTTGHILAMVGSRDYFDEKIDGNFNVTIQPNRQPGSAFKPFVYATAFKEGYTPETVIFDLETQFNANCNPDGEPIEPGVEEDECYSPGNYDGSFRGPITFRNALAQSINIPAVKVLYLSGIKNALETAKDMGITSLTNPNQYGLTLVLGGGEVSVLEMTSAYGVFANGGERNKSTGIIEVKDRNGNILESFTPKPERVLPENVALTISSILSDNNARAPVFGERSPLYFSNAEVAAKTGTTNDFRDAWIIGYTPNIAVGTWAGNNNNSPMKKEIAGFVVAPMWREFMQEALRRYPPKPFKEPKKDSEYDTLSPRLRGVWLGGETYMVDTISGKLATDYTPEETKAERVIPSVHSILYWIQKNDPRGEKPENPDKDPQFALWEYPVVKWASNLGITEGTTSDKPIEYDSVHTPENKPNITVTGIKSSAYETFERVGLSVIGGGTYPLSRVDLFINNAYISSSNTKPFNFSFTPQDIDGVVRENTLRIVGYDEVQNKKEELLPFLVNI